ncbi:MAG: DPP IV N-terminal domain-containing protein [Bacteroidota bacterium]
MKSTTLPFLFLLVMSCFAPTNSHAQALQLSLKDAILKSRSTLGPERISGLEWIAEVDELSYYNTNRTELLRQVPGTKTKTTIATVEDLNTACQLQLQRIPPIRWMESDRFYFHSGTAYYAFETKTKKGYELLSHPENAANRDFIVKYDRLAYTIDHNLFLAKSGNEQIEVVNNKDANIVSGQAIARYEFGISKGTFWSPQGNILAFYQKDETDVADYPLLDITTTPGTLRTVKYPMAGQKSEYGKVGIYHRRSKQLLYLKVGGPKDQYLTNLGWDPSEQYVYVAVVNRDQNKMQLNKYDVKTGDLVKTLFEETHEKYVEPESPVWFLPNKADEFLWMSERDGFMHVYRYNSDGELLNQVTKGNWVALNILGLDASGNNLVVEGTDESGLNRYAYLAALDGSTQRQIPGAPGVHRFQLSNTGKHLIDQYSSLEEPGMVNVIDLEGKVIVNLLTSKNPVEGYAFPTTELVQVNADNGTPLHARLIKPSHFSPQQKYPVLVYVYGGPHAQMVSNRWLAGAPMWMHYMAEKGYLIFTIDNRGSANRGFEFENIIHRQLGKIEMSDQLAGVSYLKSLPFVDAERMAVHGWSYGGFMTTSLMLRQPGVFKAGVAGGPVTDWKYYEVMYGERYMDRPEENPEGYAENSLLNYAKNLEGDLLLIHGTVDDVVVMQHNLALVQQFVRAGILVDFMPYPMHPHNVRGRDRVHLMDKVLTYIEDKLGE